MMPIKVGMISLGCPKNQVDAETMLARLSGAGYYITPHAGLADVVIINTCGFIEDAKKESIENILEMAQLKKEGTIKGIVVSGCLAQRYYEELQKEFSEVNCVVQVGCAGSIEKAVIAANEGKQCFLKGKPEELAFGGERILTTLPCFAYLKIAEGCDNCCTYCVIPTLRGRFRSRPMEELVLEAESLVNRGVKELILVAQDTTRYGEDLYKSFKLPELLRKLCKIEKLKWIRLLYCYPDRITDELIEVITTEEKIQKYIDMPIQHVNDRIVRDMNRHMYKPEIIALINKLREKVPGITLRTTVIVGFPGETEAEFEELAEFVKEIRFERLGAFAYSCEEGTIAAAMEGQLEEKEKLHRQENIMNEQFTIMDAYNNLKIGEKIEVMNEGFDRHADCYFGRSSGDAPDIDGKIFFTSEKKLKIGDFVNVKIDEVLDCDLFGQVIGRSES
jgi:ribosomal protein S12 methylthiotransferase